MRSDGADHQTSERSTVDTSVGEAECLHRNTDASASTNFLNPVARGSATVTPAQGVVRRAWRVRLHPRKERSDKGTRKREQPDVPCVPAEMLPGPLTQDGVRAIKSRSRTSGGAEQTERKQREKKRRLAKSPAGPLPAVRAIEDARRTPVRALVQSDCWVARLRAGRTIERLHILMGWHLFRRNDRSDDELSGCFATTEAGPAFIIATYSRYNVMMADVLPLRQSGRDLARPQFAATLSSIRSVRYSELSDIGQHFKVKPP